MKTEDNFRFDRDKPVRAENLTLPIWAVWCIIGIVFTGTVAGAAKMFNIDAKLDAVWTLQDQREYSSQSERMNKGYSAPDVWDIRRKTRP